MILNIFLIGVQKHSLLDFTAVVVILDVVFVIFVLAQSSQDFAVIFVIFQPDCHDFCIEYTSLDFGVVFVLFGRFVLPYTGLPNFGDSRHSFLNDVQYILCEISPWIS